MSTGLILGFGLVGGLIAFAVSFSAVSVEYGLIRFFMIAMISGIGIVAGGFMEVGIRFVADKDGSEKLWYPQFGPCYTRSEEFATFSGISGNRNN